MSEAVPIVRNTNNTIVHLQRKQIMINLASPELSAIYKRVIQKWLTTKESVSDNTVLKTALLASNAIKAIW